MAKIRSKTTSLDTIRDLRDEASARFVEIGHEVIFLTSSYGMRIKDIAKLVSMSPRTLAHYRRVAAAIEEGRLSYGDALKLGWAKATVLASVLDKSNTSKALVRAAMGRSVEEVKADVNGGEALIQVGLRFTPDEFHLFEKAIERVGYRPGRMRKEAAVAKVAAISLGRINPRKRLDPIDAQFEVVSRR